MWETTNTRIVNEFITTLARSTWSWAQLDCPSFSLLWTWRAEQSTLTVDVYRFLKDLPKLHKPQRSTFRFKPPVTLTCGRAGLPHEVVVLAGDGGSLQVAVGVVQERLGAGLGLLLQLVGRQVQLLLHFLSGRGVHVSVVAAQKCHFFLFFLFFFARVSVTHPVLLDLDVHEQGG